MKEVVCDLFSMVCRQTFKRVEGKEALTLNERIPQGRVSGQVNSCLLIECEVSRAL
jgi:hypothetical protein